MLALKPKHPHIRLVAAVPFVLQHGVWPVPAKREYSKILKRADLICLVDTEEVISFDDLHARYAKTSTPERSYVARWLFARNAWMVDRCDSLLAVYRDSESGGTKNCVEYAVKKDVRVVRYHPDTHATELYHDAIRPRENKKPLFADSGQG